MIELTTSNTSTENTEEAVLPPTYAKLPTTKLEEEPNPFEQSFEGATKAAEIMPLPPERIIPDPMLDTTSKKMDCFNPICMNFLLFLCVIGNANNKQSATTFYNTFDNKPQSEESKKPTKRARKNTIKEATTIEDEIKRKNFLERNRIAALKCRQRKKQWLQNLQAKVEYLTADNEQYHLQANALREELINLKTLLMAHKDCPINQQAIQNALNRPIPGLPSLGQPPYEYINNISIIQPPLPPHPK
ncbi:Putative Activating transcription factor, other eukaryote [Rhizopus microsporus]|nr:Putative Activating transcription factor, other eukaryote [Rhizopus microsporus]